MAMDPVSAPDLPTGGTPIALSPETFARHAAAVNWVENQNRVLRPRAGRGQGVGRAAGAWGYLAPSATISGVTCTVSGGVTTLTLGTGTVTLCSRNGATLTANGDTVTVYNGGGSMTANSNGRILKLGWTDGDWSVDVAKCS